MQLCLLYAFHRRRIVRINEYLVVKKADDIPVHEAPTLRWHIVHNNANHFIILQTNIMDFWHWDCGIFSDKPKMPFIAVGLFESTNILW
jgi:hypothetical protein